MKSFQSLLDGQTLLPIIQADTVEQGVDIAKAMAAAGLKLVEVVLRTEQSLAALMAIKQQVPEIIVGAGTVTNETIMEQAIEAGADFIVTPAVSDKLLSELVTELKLFPASLSGGAPFLKAVGSVFQDIVFCPTGGVSPANKQDYLALDNVIAVGGTWVCKKEWVVNNRWQSIIDSCFAAVT